MMVRNHALFSMIKSATFFMVNLSDQGVVLKIGIDINARNGAL
jgi:hypothetical protein